MDNRAHYGQFEVTRELGGEAATAVYAGRDRTSGGEVTITAWALPGGATKAWLDQCAKLRELDHAAIVTVADCGIEGGEAYVVTRGLPRRSLADYLAGQRLGLRAASAIAVRIGAALDHAHERGLVHGNIGPASIILDADGLAILGGFGVGFAGPAGDATGSDTAPRSPEQLRGEPATSASDIYSLGAVVFTALTGRPPARGAASIAADLGGAIPDLLPGIVAAVDAALRDDPSERPRSGLAFSRAFAGEPASIALLAATPSAPRVSARLVAPRETRRIRAAGRLRRVGTVLGIVAVAVPAIVGGALLLWSSLAPSEGGRPVPGGNGNGDDVATSTSAPSEGTREPGGSGTSGSNGGAEPTAPSSESAAAGSGTPGTATPGTEGTVTRRPTATPTPTATPIPAVIVTPSGGSEGISLSVSVDSYAPGGSTAQFTYTITNTGGATVDLGEVAVQSWFSADATLQDINVDCPGSAAVLPPDQLEPGASATFSFSTDYAADPIWPQCSGYSSGWVLVQVHTEFSRRYVRISVVDAFPVTRG